MKQIKYTIFSLLILTTTIFSGCDSILEDEYTISNEQQQIEVRFAKFSMDGTSSTPASGTLIFWKKNLNDFFQSPIDDLNEYSKNKYNTGEFYPYDNAMVYATGYSPTDIQTSSDYQTLTLSIANSGIADVCVAEKVIGGNQNAPFSETMNFEHTLTKVFFTVERDQTMVGNRDVRNITITIPKSYLPVEWNYNFDENKYKINSEKTANSNLKFIHPDIISGTNTDELGTAYLMLPMINSGILKNLRLTADILLTGSHEIERTIDNTLNIQLYDNDNITKVTNAKPGEAYEVCIRFQQNSFTLIARQLDNWEQGGLIYVPIKP
ncbi:hypothetical protein [Bacteroides sp.]|uniref:hypothetical protein n=1 Tax=Bacteroides sp. TaxID=29523 RepID=UPI002639743F|nr:hypothetical protein [Bacteroides sp.]MDD3038946.1 hypothetical protein [Bacteroides sp.]